MVRALVLLGVLAGAVAAQSPAGNNVEAAVVDGPAADASVQEPEQERRSLADRLRDDRGRDDWRDDWRDNDRCRGLERLRDERCRDGDRYRDGDRWRNGGSASKPASATKAVLAAVAVAFGGMAAL